MTIDDKMSEGDKNNEEWSLVTRKAGWKEKEEKSASFVEAVRKGMSKSGIAGKNETKEKYPESGPPGFREGDEKELKIRPIRYNGRPFSGFVTHAEAIRNVYQEGMKLDTSNLREMI